MDSSIYYIGYFHLGKPFGHGRMVYDNGSFYVIITIYMRRENGFLEILLEVEYFIPPMEI